MKNATNSSSNPLRFALLFFVMAFLMIGSAYAADTGFKSPTVTSSNSGWSSPDNAWVSDGSRASADSSSDVVAYSTFDFPSIPAGATIIGIEVKVEGYRTDDRQIDVSLSGNGGSTYSGTELTALPKDSSFPFSDGFSTLGDSTDTWGTSWAPGDFTNGNFRVKLDATNSGDTVNVDHVQVKVYYEVEGLLCVSKDGGTFASVSFSGSNNDWDSEGDAATSNNDYAEVSLDDNWQSEYLRGTGFGFSIPAGSTIYGIIVGVERKATESGKIDDYRVRAVKNSVIGSDTNHDTDFSDWGSSDATVSYGTNTDLWGDSWSVSDVNDPDFGVAFSAEKGTSSGGALTAKVDKLNMTVCYLPPEQTTLKVVKTFVNDNGGTASSVQLYIDGTPVSNNTDVNVTAGGPNIFCTTLTG